MPLVQGGHPLGVEQPAAVAAGQRGEGDRSVRRPERGGAGRAHRDAEQFGGDPRGEDAGRLALVVRRADGGVALDVLDRAQPGPDRAGDVGHGGVPLQVDELGAARGGGGVRHPPQHERRGRDGGRRRGRQRVIGGGLARQPRQPRQLCQRRPGRPPPVGQAAGQVEDAGGGPGDDQAREVFTGQEGTERLVVAEPAAGLAEQVHRGIPAPAHQQQVAGDRAARADSLAGQRRDVGAGHPFAAVRAGHDRPGQHRNAGPRALGAVPRRRARPGIDDRLDPDAGPVQVERGVVGAVVRGEHDRVAAGQHAVAVQEGAGGGGEHDPRPVVVGEHDRALVRPGRHDHLPGPEAPYPLPRLVPRRGRAEVVGAPLQREHEAVVVAAERGGALQVQHVRPGGQLRYRGGHPVRRRGAVEFVAARQQRAARLGLLVDQGDAGPGARRAERGREPGGAGPHDQHVDVLVDGVVTGGVGDVRQAPLPGQAAGHQPVTEFDGGGEQHRLGEGLLDLDQPGRVLGPRRGDPARPPELDAGRDLVSAGREERGGQRVTGMAREAHPVEGEPQRRRPVDAAAPGGAERAAHDVAGFGSSRRPVSSRR